MEDTDERIERLFDDGSTKTVGRLRQLLDFSETAQEKLIRHPETEKFLYHQFIIGEQWRRYPDREELSVAAELLEKWLWYRRDGLEEIEQIKRGMAHYFSWRLYEKGVAADEYRRRLNFLESVANNREELLELFGTKVSVRYLEWYRDKERQDEHGACLREFCKHMIGHGQPVWNVLLLYLAANGSDAGPDLEFLKDFSTLYGEKEITVCWSSFWKYLNWGHRIGGMFSHLQYRKEMDSETCRDFAKWMAFHVRFRRGEKDAWDEVVCSLLYLTYICSEAQVIALLNRNVYPEELLPKVIQVLKRGNGIEKIPLLIQRMHEGYDREERNGRPEENENTGARTTGEGERDGTVGSSYDAGRDGGSLL